MKTRFEGRLDVLIDALCALAETLPADARQTVGVALVRRIANRSLADEAADAAVARDVSRVPGGARVPPESADRLRRYPVCRT